MKKTFIIFSTILGFLTFFMPAFTYAQIPLVSGVSGSQHVAHIPILIYHSVRPYYPGITNLVKEFTVPPDVFDDQMKYLRDNGFTIVTPDSLWMFLHDGIPLPSKPVMITLDDGWENQYVYAFPILKKYKYAGVFYVYPGAVNKKHFLSWLEIKNMVSDGMIIADHTQTHPELQKINDQTILNKEIAGSKALIEKMIGVSVKDFAYPFGAYDNQTIQTVKDSGYRMARTVNTGVKADSNAPYTIDGIIITGDFNRFVSLVNK